MSAFPIWALPCCASSNATASSFLLFSLLNDGETNHSACPCGDLRSDPLRIMCCLAVRGVSDRMFVRYIVSWVGVAYVVGSVTIAQCISQTVRQYRSICAQILTFLSSSSSLSLSLSFKRRRPRIESGSLARISHELAPAPSAAHFPAPNLPRHESRTSNSGLLLLGLSRIQDCLVKRLRRRQLTSSHGSVSAFLDAVWRSGCDVVCGMRLDGADRYWNIHRNEDTRLHMLDFAGAGC